VKRTDARQGYELASAVTTAQRSQPFVLPPSLTHSSATLPSTACAYLYPPSGHALFHLPRLHHLAIPNPQPHSLVIPRHQLSSTLTTTTTTTITTTTTTLLPTPVFPTSSSAPPHMSTTQSTASPRAPRGQHTPRGANQAAPDANGRQSQRRPRGNRANNQHAHQNAAGASPSKPRSKADPTRSHQPSARLLLRKPP
jgi:hypothetical protein